MTRVAGIDIARGAWLIVYLDRGAFDDAVVVDRLSGVSVDADVVAIDVPLDLPTSSIGRRAEREARQRLGPRRNAVFSSLPGELYDTDYTEESRRAAREVWNVVQQTGLESGLGDPRRCRGALGELV